MLFAPGKVVDAIDRSRGRLKEFNCTDGALHDALKVQVNPSLPWKDGSTMLKNAADITLSRLLWRWRLSRLSCYTLGDELSCARLFPNGERIWSHPIDSQGEIAYCLLFPTQKLNSKAIKCF